jgi:hypothetical protein
MRTKRARPRFPPDKLSSTIVQYRRLAQWAYANARATADPDGKEWFSSLALRMTAIADAAEKQSHDAVKGPD